LEGASRRALAAALALGLLTTAAWAELGSDEYGGRGSSLSEEQRARLRAEIEADRQREVERALALERAQAAAEARRQAALAEARARLPPAAVLAETHCTACHAPEVLAAARHTWLGWHLTALRMRYLNGARIPFRDLGAIAAHLSRTQGASTLRALVEYGLVVSLVLLGWVSGAYGLRLWRRARGADTAGG
jgi:hypothetical protein